ncbi:MAG: hypothetical protein PVF51_06765 [Nitrospirota bacterium]|jgi:uncharacterized protein YdcH (DUF465 family)
MPFSGPRAERAREEVPRFTMLEKAHGDYEKELQGLERHLHLTPEMENRRTVLKKLKLQAKDEMRMILASM